MGELHIIESLDRQPFKYMVSTIGNLPTSFVDSMSYYELIAWLCQYIEKTVIPAIDGNAEALQELQAYYVELKQYVDDYFSDLNVQAQIDNKLDEMAQSGALAEIINQEIFGEINSQISSLGDDIDALETELGNDVEALEAKIGTKITAFDSVSAMKQATTLANGSYARTGGFYSVNDQGGALYYVRTKNDGETINEMDKIAIGEELVACLVYDKAAINPAKLGAKLDGETDDTSIVGRCLELGDTIFPAGSNVFINNLHMVPYRKLDFSNSEVNCNGCAIVMGSDQATSYFRDARVENAHFNNAAESDASLGLKTVYMCNVIRSSLKNITCSHVNKGTCAIWIENCFNIKIDEVFLGNGNSSKTAGSAGIVVIANTATSYGGTNNITNVSIQHGLIQNLIAGINLKITNGSIDTVLIDDIGISNTDNGYVFEGTASSTKNITLSNSRVEGSNIGVYNFGALHIHDLNINFLSKTDAIGIYNRAPANLVATGYVGFINRSVSMINQGFADFSGCHTIASASLTPANLTKPITRPVVMDNTTHTGTNFGDFIHPFNDYVIKQADAYEKTDLPTTGLFNGMSLTILHNGEMKKYTFLDNVWYDN